MFLQEAKQEFQRVNWPTLPETLRLTAIVVVFSLAIAFFLGVLDTAFTYLLSQII